MSLKCFNRHGLYDIAILFRAKHPPFGRFLSLFRANFFPSSTAFLDLWENALPVIVRNHTRYEVAADAYFFSLLFESCSSFVFAASATSPLVLFPSRGSFRCIFKEKIFVCNKSASIYKSEKRLSLCKNLKKSIYYRNNKKKSQIELLCN